MTSHPEREADTHTWVATYTYNTGVNRKSAAAYSGIDVGEETDPDALAYIPVGVMSAGRMFDDRVTIRGRFPSEAAAMAALLQSLDMGSCVLRRNPYYGGYLISPRRRAANS